jgi:serine phosphatase RsbU (regulator of sigma subunit)
MPAPEYVLQCSEVWGGNDKVDRGVRMPGLDAWVLSRPHAGDAAGGDIHYVSSCATGRITRVLLADVAGHGSGVADLAGRLRGLMRRHVNTVDQSRLAGAINTEFAALSDAGRFATALIATIWGPTGEVELTSAGHPPPLIYRAAQRRWSAFAPAPTEHPAPGDAAPAGLPLGVVDDTRYDRAVIRLDAGDLLLLYTDGVVEARDAATNDLLGDEGLARLLGALDPADPEALLPALYRALAHAARRETPDDDTTLVLLRANPQTRPRGSPALALAAGWRLAREFAASLLPGRPRFAWPQFTRENMLGAWLDRFNQRRG